MTDAEAERLAGRSSVKIARMAAVVSLAAGTCGLAGWLTGIAALKSVAAGWVAMKANTGPCAINTACTGPS